MGLSGLGRFLVYSGFDLDRFSVYADFDLDRFHCIQKVERKWKTRMQRLLTVVTKIYKPE